MCWASARHLPTVIKYPAKLQEIAAEGRLSASSPRTLKHAMIVKSVIVCISLAAALPVLAAPAPLATSRVVRLPDIVTMTLGAVLPTEIPNLPASDMASAQRLPSMGNVPGLTDATAHIPGTANMAAPVDFSSLFRRQIRINNYDATNNSMTAPLFRGMPALFARNRKSDAMAAASEQAAAAAAPPPSPPPASGAAVPMQAVAGGIQGLGAARMQGSDAFHEALGGVFNPAAALQNPDPSATTSSSAPMPTLKKTAAPLPVGPGYTTDTMDTTLPGEAPKKPKVKRHTFMMDLNALLPEPTPESAMAKPAQAWQDDALFEFDSNRKPDPKLLSQNVTNVAKNVTSAAQGPSPTLKARGC